MLPEEIKKVCRKVFMSVLGQDTGLQGKNWCVFDPYKDTKFNLVFLIVNEETGYGVPITIDKQYIAILDTDVIEALVVRFMGSMKVVIQKHMDKAKPVDYKLQPLKVQGKTSVLDSVETLEGSKVEFYRWSNIILN